MELKDFRNLISMKTTKTSGNAHTSERGPITEPITDGWILIKV